MGAETAVRVPAGEARRSWVVGGVVRSRQKGRGGQAADRRRLFALVRAARMARFARREDKSGPGRADDEYVAKPRPSCRE